MLSNSLSNILLVVCVLVTCGVAVAWKKAVIQGEGEGSEASIARAVRAAFWCTALMVIAFFTLELFARNLAVWTGYANQAFPR